MSTTLFGREEKAAVKKFFVVQEDVRQSAAIQHEIAILKTLVDRHVIQFYGTAYHEGMLPLIMEYAEGGSLKRAIDGRRVTDWRTKKRLAQEVAYGLAYIYLEGVIHRDLKSMNVLLTHRMEVKLCDFGLATLKVCSVSSTTTLKGTIRWMAPELFALRPKYSTKSDMYALGMELPEDTPDDYRKWVERCWDHDPLKRPEASEMVVVDNVPDHDREAGADVSVVIAAGDVLDLSKWHLSNEGAEEAIENTSQASENMKALLTRANENDVQALLALASIYENGTGVDHDDTEAFKWNLRAAELRSTVAEADWR
ncbi:hypothetical protein BGZ73_000523 [Actinomortierella ambigua]|nr:hypothetical protein BGZ73_000523 [Actinomortierella ambigua]